VNIQKKQIQELEEMVARSEKILNSPICGLENGLPKHFEKRLDTYDKCCHSRPCQYKVEDETGRYCLYRDYKKMREI